MITMETLCSTIWVLLALNNLSLPVLTCVKNFITHAWNALKDLETLTLCFYLEKTSLKISSGADFQTDWVTFKSDLAKNLSLLNIEWTLTKEIDRLPSKMVQFKLFSGLNNLLGCLNQSLHLYLHQFLKNYADNEIDSITKNLQAENFFNLSKYVVNPALKTRLAAGRKLTPYLKINVRKELKNIDNEIFDIFSNLSWGIKKPFASKNVPNLFETLKNSQRFRLNPAMLDHLTSIFNSYKRTRKSFLNHLLKTCSQSIHDDEFALQSDFSLNPNQIVVSADKNIGFVCMDVDNLWRQYSKINCQQNFGKVDILETDYLKFILEFISLAASNIPNELSLIVKSSDFSWKHPVSSIGVLRLMSKILKL